MSVTKKKTVLFLPAWYPNRTHSSVGSFIRSHAEALNGKLNVDILHVCGDESQKKLYDFQYHVINGIDTYIIYFRKTKSKNIFFQLWKALLYVVGQFYGYYLYRKQKPKPLFFHVHVLTRAAILPYVMHRLGFEANYYVTEHWSRYLPQDNSYKGFLRKILTKSVVRNAKGVTAVSQCLKLHMNKHQLNHQNFQVISNVISNVFFEKNKYDVVKNHFVHVSNFAGNCKNVLGILNAFKLLQDEGLLFTLTMVGDGDDFEVAQKSVNIKGLKNVNFTGFVGVSDVIKHISEAEALVLFSNYETQSVTVMESLSLGVPVIATAVGGVPEITTAENSILVEPGNVEALASAIKKVIQGEISFNKDRCRQNAAQNFNSETIAQKFMELYRNGGANV